MINRDLKNYGKCKHTLFVELLSAIACISCVGMIFFQLNFRPSTKGQLDCQMCHSRELQKRDKLTNYFRKNGSKTPEEMANAVLKPRSPRLMAAIAVKETGGNPSTRATGYKRRHHGAFQVNPAVWSPVPKDAIGQALQSEAILSELVAEKGDITKALNAYGGSTKGTYARMILAELVEVPR